MIEGIRGFGAEEAGETYDSLEDTFQLTIKWFRLDMLLVIEFCFHTAHFFIKILTFNRGVGGDVQFGSTMIFCPFLCRKKEFFANSQTAHILRYMDTG